MACSNTFARQMRHPHLDHKACVIPRWMVRDYVMIIILSFSIFVCRFLICAMLDTSIFSATTIHGLLRGITFTCRDACLTIVVDSDDLGLYRCV